MRIMICLAYHFSAVLCLFFSRVVRIVLIPTWVLAKKRPIHLPKKSTPGFRSSASLRKGKGTSMSNRGVQKKLCHSSGNCQLQTQPFDQVILLTPCESRNHSLHRRFFKEAFLHHRITLLWMTHNEHIATSHYCHHKSHHYLTSHYAPHYHKSIQTITLHHSTRSKSSSAATSVQAGTPARFERTGPLVRASLLSEATFFRGGSRLHDCSWPGPFLHSTGPGVLEAHEVVASAQTAADYSQTCPLSPSAHQESSLSYGPPTSSGPSILQSLRVGADRPRQRSLAAPPHLRTSCSDQRRARFFLSEDVNRIYCRRLNNEVLTTYS